MESVQTYYLQPEIFSDGRVYAQTFNPFQMLVLDEFIAQEAVAQNYLPEVKRCESYIHRVKMGGFKKSGSVGRSTLKKHAPNLHNLYYSPWLHTFIESVVGVKLYRCPEWDEHGVALYYYTEPGDHIGVHYDKSFYKGKRYTVLLGMVQDSTESNLMCYRGASKFNRYKNPLKVITHPGTLVLFNGDKLWHEVTPLGKNEYRAILTLEYLTTPEISKFNRLVTDIKDRYLYFGKKNKG